LLITIQYQPYSERKNWNQLSTQNNTRVSSKIQPWQLKGKYHQSGRKQPTAKGKPENMKTTPTRTVQRGITRMTEKKLYRGGIACYNHEKRKNCSEGIWCDCEGCGNRNSKKDEGQRWVTQGASNKSTIVKGDSDNREDSPIACKSTQTTKDITIVRGSRKIRENGTFLSCIIQLPWRFR
jgi:hypothetical protein